jgi:hypothetical protein
MTVTSKREKEKREEEGKKCTTIVGWVLDLDVKSKYSDDGVHGLIVPTNTA